MSLNIHPPAGNMPTELLPAWKHRAKPLRAGKSDQSRSSFTLCDRAKSFFSFCTV